MSPIETLAPISLAELLEDAELQIRTDRKYLIEASRVPDILAALEGARVLDIGGRRCFGYVSTYFDTPELVAHARAAHRRRRRFKVRTRTYADSGQTWLEIKTRGRRGITVKDRMPIAGTRLDAAAREHVRACLEAAHVEGVEVAELQPVLHSRYRRSTLLLPDGARVTIDTELVWQLAEGPVHEAGAVAVIETKSPPGTGPCALDRELATRGVRTARISKYATGLALMVPTVPHNRWHRTLTGPLAGPGTTAAWSAPGHANRAGSPAPTRTTSGAPSEKSITVVGTSPHSPESITPSRR